ncbi:hypothetical protein OSB04_010101 [Centaurea solstitialis]|uniref:Polyamine transporter n=1 Tax=Centaurea solstitialis TaxID=347529 RepID=A0AA38WBK5_9ASTR|nr:hypothetical protein OSB04_010101 [Centaurea solstitialis]
MCLVPSGVFNVDNDDCDKDGVFDERGDSRRHLLIKLCKSKRMGKTNLCELIFECKLHGKNPFTTKSQTSSIMTIESPPPATTAAATDAATGDNVLPVTNPSKTIVKNRKKLTLIPLIFLIYFEVAGGPYGEEPAVKAAGPLFAILGFSIFPFIWSIPEALVTAELSTAFPGNGGYIIWAHKAFGPFFGSLMGTWKFLTGVINLAAFPILCADYLDKLFPVFKKGWPRTLAIVSANVLLSFLNYTGLNIVGYAAITLGVVSLMPFVLMSAIAIPKIQPHRWLSTGQPGVKKDWNLYYNTLFWNLNFWDSVSTMAGEVEKPNKTFPAALFFAVILTCLAYILPLVAVTGAITVDQSQWESGFMAVAAETIAGKWLKIWIDVGSVLSAIGLFEALLSSCAYQVLGMADLGFLPKFFEVRSKWFNTPWVGILVSTVITICFSFMDFTYIISSANFIYSLGMLLEFASFIWLRVKLPALKRPYRVPLRVPALVVMCLVPSAFLVLIMVIATKMVFLTSGVITAIAIVWYFLMKLFKSKKWFAFKNGDQIIEEYEPSAMGVGRDPIPNRYPGNTAEGIRHGSRYGTLVPIFTTIGMELLFPVFIKGWPRTLAIVSANVLLSFLNYTGLNIVSYAAITLGVVSLMAFLLMSAIAIPKIQPHRVSTMAGEVEKPNKTFPAALFSAVILTCLAYMLPLVAVTGAITVDQSQWESGFMVVAAETIAGKWLKIWIDVGSVLSAIGLFEALLSSCAYQVLGMADLGFLPKFFEVRSTWFNTPWVGILVSAVITICFSFMDFTYIISSANFIYSLGMLLEFASFIWLRVKLPALKRPYRVPLRVPALVVMCLVPSAFLILIMVIATKEVFLTSGVITAITIVWYLLMKLFKSNKWFAFKNGDQAIEEYE